MTTDRGPYTLLAIQAASRALDAGLEAACATLRAGLVEASEDAKVRATAIRRFERALAVCVDAHELALASIAKRLPVGPSQEGT